MNDGPHETVDLAEPPPLGAAAPGDERSFSNLAEWTGVDLDDRHVVALLDQIPAGGAAGDGRTRRHGVRVERVEKTGCAAGIDIRAHLAEIADVVDEGDAEVAEEPERLHFADSSGEIRTRRLEIVDMDLEERVVIRVEYEGDVFIEPGEDGAPPSRGTGEPEEQGAIVKADGVGIHDDLVDRKSVV